MTDKADKTELKPCPFCGDSEIIMRDWRRASPVYFVRCQGCLISTPSMATSNAAIVMWNSRAVNSHDALVGACEAIITAEQAYALREDDQYQLLCEAYDLAVAALAQGETP